MRPTFAPPHDRLAPWASRQYLTHGTCVSCGALHVVDCRRACLRVVDMRFLVGARGDRGVDDTLAFPDGICLMCRVSQRVHSSSQIGVIILLADECYVLRV